MKSGDMMTGDRLVRKYIAAIFCVWTREGIIIIIIIYAFLIIVQLNQRYAKLSLTKYNIEECPYSQYGMGEGLHLTLILIVWFRIQKYKILHG